MKRINIRGALQLIISIYFKNFSSKYEIIFLFKMKRNQGKFGKLIGVLEVGNSYCKFLVSWHLYSFDIKAIIYFVYKILTNFQIYALKNSEILTQHEIRINKFDSLNGDEYDPIELWNAIQDVRSFIDFSIIQQK